MKVYEVIWPEFLVALVLLIGPEVFLGGGKRNSGPNGAREDGEDA